MRSISKNRPAQVAPLINLKQWETSEEFPNTSRWHPSRYMTCFNLPYFATITLKSDPPQYQAISHFYTSWPVHIGTTLLQGLYGKIPLILQVIMPVWKKSVCRPHTSAKHFWPYHSSQAEWIHLPCPTQLSIFHLSHTNYLFQSLLPPMRMAATSEKEQLYSLSNLGTHKSLRFKC